jgi:hypothetical protein
LTFDWSIFNFLSCLENSIALNHISKLHTLLKKLSHTHALHELSNLFKISIWKEICAYWILNSQLYLCIFWNAIWLPYQLFIHACSEANFKENIFLQIFLCFLAFQCEASRRTWLIVWRQAALPIANLVVYYLDKLVTRPDVILTVIFLPLSFSASSTQLHFYWFIMSCCVFFSRISNDILAFSAHLFSFHDILCVFLYSFKFLYFLEYWIFVDWNIFLRYCAWKSYFVYVFDWYWYIWVFWIVIFTYIFFCIQLTAVIIPHCFWN